MNNGPFKDSDNQDLGSNQTFKDMNKRLAAIDKTLKDIQQQQNTISTVVGVDRNDRSCATLCGENIGSILNGVQRLATDPLLCFFRFLDTLNQTPVGQHFVEEVIEEDDALQRASKLKSN